MPAPLIGVTVHPNTAPDRAELDTLLEAIVRGIERAGGLPALIPLGLTEAVLYALYKRLDGALFSGGGDIAPARYGAESHPAISGVDAERDRAEFDLMRWAINNGKPFFGICRGAQVLNVALGGTLYRDHAELSGAGRHDHPAPEFPSDFLAHTIKIEEESTLGRIIGQPLIDVNSMHHQSCQTLGPGLRATAVAADGVVEALEIPGRPFALGVQWHPECLPRTPEMRRLFESFVEAAEAGYVHR
jgi:putative glutamine amidotransferase